MITKILSYLRPLISTFSAVVILALVVVSQVHADPTNLFTGCLKAGKLQSAQVGTSPITPCGVGETQVSADYGDITNVIAGSGLSGGATQGSATLSVATSGITNTMLANSSVTAAKINSESATNGQVLTANGSGGAAWQSPTGGTLSGVQSAHSKSLTNNTDNSLFTFPIATGEAESVHIFTHLVAKKGSDWGFAQFDWAGSMYFDGTTLQENAGDIISREAMNNAGAITLTVYNLSSQNTVTFSYSSGVVTVSFNPGNVGTDPDSIVLDYVVVNPAGKTLTFIP